MRNEENIGHTVRGKRTITSLSLTRKFLFYVNPLSAKFIKWSNTLKQIVGNFPTICLSVFDHFSGLAFKGLRKKNKNKCLYLSIN